VTTRSNIRISSNHFDDHQLGRKHLKFHGSISVLRDLFQFNMKMTREAILEQNDQKTEIVNIKPVFI
jgi:hypothetical protein